MIDSYSLKVVERYLGQGGYETKGNIPFICPFCHHHKKKLQVKLDPTSQAFGFWHCWVCNESGKTIESLLHSLNIDSTTVLTVKTYIDTYIRKRKTSQTNNEGSSNLIFLPKEFKPLYIKEKNNPEYRNALYYVLKKRKLSPLEILRYNIGFCEEGRFAKRIIIPSYDANGRLNYFTARAYYEDDPMSYINVNLSRDIVGFELFINWNLPISLFEGPFDAIAYRRNAIPLFGKQIPKALKLKIIQNKVKDIYLGLDPDAIKDSIKLIEEFYKQGLNVYFLQMTNNNDAAKEGYEKLLEITDNTEKIKFSDIIKLKLKKK